MKLKKALKHVEKIAEVTKLSNKARVKLLREFTGIEDGETLTAAILEQGYTLQNIRLAASVANDWHMWTKEDVERINRFS